MANNFGDLVVRVGADISGFKDAFKSAIDLLDTAGDKANKAGAVISKAFANLGVGDASAKLASQAKSLQASFELLEKAFKDGKIGAEDFAKAQVGLRNELEKLNRIDYTSGLEKLESKLDKIGSKAQEFGKFLSASLTLPLVGFAGAAVKSAADLESLEIGLKAVTKETGPLEVQLGRLKEVAKLPGLGFKEAVQGSINLQAAGFSAQTAERALSSFGNALATVGKGRADLDGVVTALSQIASKGKVSAEEINQLAERLPQIRVAIKDAFGEGFTDAKAFEAAGISAEQFVEKIITQFEKLPKAAGGFKNEMENLADSFDQSLAAVGKSLIPFATTALQALQPLIGVIQSMAAEFATMPAAAQNAVVGIAALAAAAGPALYAFGGISKGLSEITPLLGKLATAGAPAGQALGAVSLSAGLLAGTLVTLAAAIAGLSLYEAFKGGSDIAQTLKDISDNSKQAEQGLAGVGKATAETGGFFDGLVSKAKLLAEVGGERLWNALYPPAGISRAFQDLDIDIQRVANRFPDLEKAARKGQDAVNSFARAQADQAMNGIGKAVDAGVAAIQKQNSENLQRLEVAEKTLKTLKTLKASKAELAAATEAVTLAQRKLHPEFVATGNAAGSYGRKLDEAKNKVLGFNKALLDSLVAARKAQQDLNLADTKELDFRFKLITGEFDNDVAKLVAGVDQVQDKLRGLQVISKEAQDVLDNLFKEGIKDLSKLDEAYKATGQKTLGELKDAADKTAAAYKEIGAAAQVGVGGAISVLKAEKAMLEDRIALSQAQGKSTEEDLKRLEAVNQKLADQGVKVKGVKDSWLDFSKEVSTIITNFAQDIGKSLFDGTKDWGEKFTSLWKSLAGAVTATFITPITAALTKFVTTTLSDLIGGKGFGGLHKSITDVGDALKRVFGGASSAKGATDAAKGATDAAKGVTDAAKGATGSLSSVGNLTGLVSAVSGVVDAISSVFANFQFAAMNKSLDIIVKHTLETVNELRNLRSDAWKREGNLFGKLDDIWRSVLEIKDYLGNQIITALEGSAETLKNIFTAVESGSFATREVAEGIEAPLPVLERIISAITDGTTNIVAAIREFGVSGGGAGGPGASGATSAGLLAELQMKLRDMLEAQFNAISELPAEIQAALKAGELITVPLTAEQQAAVLRFTELHDAIMALRDEIGKLTPDSEPAKAQSSRQISSGAIDPETMTLDPDKLKTTIVAVGGGGGDVSGVVAAIASLHEMLAANWASLFEYLTNGGSIGGKASDLGKGKKVEEIADNTAQVVDAVEQNTKAVEWTGGSLVSTMSALGSDMAATLSTGMLGVGAIVSSSMQEVGESLDKWVGRAGFDFNAIRNPAPISFMPDMAVPRSINGGSPLGRDAKHGTINHINIYGNIRNRSDVDYFVSELELAGVRV